MNKKIFIFAVIVIVLGGITVYFTMFKPGEVSTPGINTFEECISAGYPILESYPRQCKTPDNKTFTEYIGNELEKFNLIRVSTPRPNQIIQSPLTIKGEARGFWFFEASFPVKLLDGNGNLIARGIAQAQSDWMTEDFVSFQAEIEYDNPGTEKGTLILEKDNPSGLPENADELIMPVYFGPIGETMKIKVYFSNEDMDPDFSCNKVFPVEREIPKTKAVARAALKELFRGPTEEEKNQGYISWFSETTKDILETVKVENGTAYVDLKDIRQIIPNASSSCGSAEFLAEVETTLKQFPTVNRVIIAIEGNPSTFYEWIQIGCAEENDFCDETPFL